MLKTIPPWLALLVLAALLLKFWPQIRARLPF